MRYVFADCILDTQLYTLHRAGTAIRLPPKVFHVLQYLLEQRDHVVTKDALGAHVWPGQFISDATLEGAVKLARQAVGDSGRAQRLIQSRRGYGYRFVGGVTVEGLAGAAPPRQEGPSLVAAGPEAAPPRPPVGSSLAHAAGVSPPAPGQTAPPAAGPSVPEPASLGGVPWPGTPDAERRQLTVLFCDLVDSTVLASQLDPEDLRAVVRAYHAACAAVVQRFAGHIAQYLGDGLLVYFGYPQAQEDDTQRAVRTGLGLVAALKPLKARLEPAYGIRLAVRVGIHTGLVVVGALGEGERQEQLALGATPNLAARLQEVAAPDTVVMSAATAQLVAGYFVCQPRGAQALKGLATPVDVNEVLHASGAQTRLDIVPPRGLTPLVGREEEVALLHRRWAQATSGQGQVVLLSGEPGIGKSRLVQVLQDQGTAAPHTCIAWRGSPLHQQSALYPVVAELSRRLGWHSDEPPAARLSTLEAILTAAGLALAEAVPLLAALLSLPLPAPYPPLTLTPHRQRQRTFDLLLAWLHAEARRQPVLLVVEDLHWLDPSTLELLSLLIDQSAARRLCLVLTARPEFHPPWPLGAHLTVLPLRRLAPAPVAGIATHVAGDKALPPAVLQEIVRKTEGVPLYVEELTKMVLELGLLEEHADHYTLPGPLPPLAIPATLHDSLMARLDRLAAVKALAQLGATLGREFSYELLQAVSSWDEGTLQRGLHQLVEAEFLYQQGLPPQAIYLFKHALIQEAAYQSLLRSTRPQHHQRIAQVLEERFPGLCETQPELLAHHYTEAGLSHQAVVYWYKAGQRAMQRSSNLEAAGHLTKGLAVLSTLPDTLERTQHELRLQLALGAVLIATKGYAAAEVENVYLRAQTLCQELGEMSRLPQVLLGLEAYYVVKAQLRRARELAEQCLTLAQRLQDPVRLLNSHYALGNILFHLGESAALHHLERGRTLYDAQPSHPRHTLQNPGVACRSYAAWALWWLGYPEQALQRSREALALAEELAHPYSRVYALCYTAGLHQYRREAQRAQEHAATAMALATEGAFPLWYAMGTCLYGWALAMQGQGEAGLAQVRQGTTAFRATGAAVFVPFLYTLLADVCDHLGYTADGLQTLAEAHTLLEQQEERYGEAEVHRLRGVLLLRQTGIPQAEAETCFQQALEVARRQEAKSLELRAAMSLSRLWQQQGKRQAAYDLLAPIYHWFTEGFDTADLKEAKALLDALA